MGLSSNIYWHQTKKDGLKGIIKNKGFYLSYGQEKFGNAEFAFPMISMCDLPFSELGSYLGKYGDYLIGMKRSWGNAKKFTPVLYLNQSSNLKEAYFKSLSNSPNNIKFHLAEILAYIKNIEGSLVKRKLKNYRFYDEREVRFVPSYEDIKLKAEEFILTSKEYEQYKYKNKSSLIKSYKVGFEWSDVKYIIVLNDKNIDECRSWCKDEDFHKIPIFTMQQVKDDFIGEFHQIDEGKIVVDIDDLKKIIVEVIRGINNSK